MCLSYNWSNIFKVILCGRKRILLKSVSHDDKFDHKELNVLISVKSCREKLQNYTYWNKAFFFKILNQDQGETLEKIFFKPWKHRNMEVSKFYCTTTSLFHNVCYAFSLWLAVLFVRTLNKQTPHLLIGQNLLSIWTQVNSKSSWIIFFIDLTPFICVFLEIIVSMLKKFL